MGRADMSLTVTPISPSNFPTIRRVVGYCPQGRAAGFLHRPSEITVVTEHDGSVEAIGEYVNEQVCRHVDINALLLIGRHTPRTIRVIRASYSPKCRD
jgi:hypothetical protein